MHSLVPAHCNSVLVGALNLEGGTSRYGSCIACIMFSFRGDSGLSLRGLSPVTPASAIMPKDLRIRLIGKSKRSVGGSSL